MSNKGTKKKKKRKEKKKSKMLKFKTNYVVRL